MISDGIDLIQLALFPLGKIRVVFVTLSCCDLRMVEAGDQDIPSETSSGWARAASGVLCL